MSFRYLVLCCLNSATTRLALQDNFRLQTGAVNVSLQPYNELLFRRSAIKRLRVLMVLEATEGGAARHVSEIASALTGLEVEVHLIYSMSRNKAFSRTVKLLQDAGVILTELDMR